MALFQFQVQYGPNPSTLSTATDVQNVKFSFGRQRPLDQYSADTASVTLRYPNGYATPNALWVTGTWIKISGRLGTSGSYQELWWGRISDVIVEYGIPYASSVGNADYVILNVEGYFANFGRVQGGGYAMAANTLSQQLSNCNTQTSLISSAFADYGAFQAFPATTISSSWGDWINRCVLTLNGRLIDYGTFISVANAYYKQTALYGNFSDTTNNATNHSYNQLNFASIADNYYTQITVDPESYSPATVSTGSKPFRTYEVNTLNNSTSQATDYANYLLSTYKTQSLRITSITCSLNSQNSDFPRSGQQYIGTQISVLFRGTTYQCVIEGGTFSGTPTEATATFYLSAQDLNNYLTLDNAVYGKLDNNKLGY